MMRKILNKNGKSRKRKIEGSVDDSNNEDDNHNDDHNDEDDHNDDDGGGYNNNDGDHDDDNRRPHVDYGRLNALIQILYTFTMLCYGSNFLASIAERVSHIYIVWNTASTQLKDELLLFVTRFCHVLVTLDFI